MGFKDTQDQTVEAGDGGGEWVLRENGGTID